MWRRSCCKRLQQQGMAALKWRLASQMNNLHNCSFMAHVATYLQHLLTFSGCEYNSQFQWHVFNVTFFYIFFEYEKLPLKKKILKLSPTTVISGELCLLLLEAGILPLPSHVQPSPQARCRTRALTKTAILSSNHQLPPRPVSST